MLETEKPITELLRRYNSGDQAVWQELVPYVYEDLRRLAHQRMRNERSGHTLSTTAVVNECYLRLIQNRQLAVATTRNSPVPPKEATTSAQGPKLAWAR